MQKRFWLGVLAGVMATVLICVVAGYVAIKSGFVPANADATPSSIERWAARTSLNAAVARDMPKEPNPVTLNEQNLLAGMKLYAQNCSICHGSQSGTPSKIARGFYQRAPQFAKRGVEDDPEGATFWKITHGIRLTAMPTFVKTLSDEQRWQITLFLKHMDALPPSVANAWKSLRTAPRRSAEGVPVKAGGKV